MNKKLTSIIDHVWLSAEAKKHVKQNKATMLRAKDMSEPGLKKWRNTYSDHFPLYFEYY